MSIPVWYNIFKNSLNLAHKKKRIPINMLVTYLLDRGFTLHCVSVLLRLNCMFLQKLVYTIDLPSSYGFVHKQWIKVHTNNGVERKNKTFKHEFLKLYKDNSLNRMVKLFIDQFHPAKEKRYTITTELSASHKWRHLTNINQHFLHKIKIHIFKIKTAILSRVV